MATEEDLRACYRLLLGREPDAGGLAYWDSAVGTLPVTDLVGAFLDSREFHLGPLYGRLLAGASPSPSGERRCVELPGRVQYVNPEDGFVGQVVAEAGMYEPHLTEAISACLGPGGTFLDVGANIGWFSLLAASLVGDTGQVVAVEADRDNSDLLLASLEANSYSHVTVLTVAAGDRAGVMRLQQLGGSNAAAYRIDEPGSAGDRLVTAVALDQLAGMFSRLDVIKIDVEGSELLVLRGAGELVDRFRPVIFMEYSPGMLLRFSESSTDDLQKWVDVHGYAASLLTFDGEVLDLTSLSEAAQYCERHKHQHVDLQLVPRRPPA